jgi:hypothetical protein
MYVCKVINIVTLSQLGRRISCSPRFCLAVTDAEEVSLAPQKQLAFGDGGRRYEHLIRESVGRHDFECLAQFDDRDHAALARQVEVAACGYRRGLEIIRLRQTPPMADDPLVILSTSCEKRGGQMGSLRPSSAIRHMKYGVWRTYFPDFLL